MIVTGRNDPCPCGSGRKFKKCCQSPPRPTPADQLYQSALQLFQAGQVAEAASQCDRVLAADPGHAEALHLSGLIAVRLGERERGFERINRAIARAPLNPVFHNSLGVSCSQQGRLDDAIAAYRQAVALQPGFGEAMNNLANALRAVGRFDEAEPLFRQLIQLKPSVGVYLNLSILLTAQSRLDEADELLRQALKLDPMNPQVHGNRIMNTLYQPDRTAADALAAARDFGLRWERSLGGQRGPHTNEPDPGRRLKIGYVSADFRRHSVAYFIEPILERHDHSRFEVFCYSINGTRDAVTERLEVMADHWVAAHAFDDDRLADRIRQDRIDILVDLCGHTAGNRTLVFARKPAPIQISWIGFPGSAGLDSIDYHLTDAIADPPGSEGEGDPERPLRLPRSFHCYRPAASLPPVAPLPLARNGYVTFGSFNMAAKHNLRVLELWARILRAIPDSRLILKGRGADSDRMQAATLPVFEAAGIVPERIRLLPHAPDEESHLRRYADVDIGLDPFPYNGVTTTCEALWMGVPVVSLRGVRHSSRICASLLSNAGLSEYIADTTDDYWTLAVALATEPARLECLRAGLREHLRGSPLMDETGITRDVEAAFRDVWQRWCREHCQ